MSEETITLKIDKSFKLGLWETIIQVGKKLGYDGVCTDHCSCSFEDFPSCGDACNGVFGYFCKCEKENVAYCITSDGQCLFEVCDY